MKKELSQLPTEIRVFPLSKIKERQHFRTIEKLYNFFLEELPQRIPLGRFNIPKDSNFIKGSLILFQYAQKKDKEEIVAHAFLKSNGCVLNNDVNGYVGYYVIDMDSIIIYNTAITKKEIFEIWGKKLFQSKLKLDVSKFDEYMRLLEEKGNL
jgi:hypothetical protein